MGISHAVDGDGIAEIVMDNPPVNALTVAGWFELADTVRGLGDDLVLGRTLVSHPVRCRPCR